MRKMMVVLCILGLVAVAASPAGAETFTITVGDGWHEFEFGTVGPWNDNFTFTVTGTPAVLKVTDYFSAGDRFAVTDQGHSIGNTSVPQSSDAYLGGTQYEDAFLDPRWSSGSFVMDLGDHDISGSVLVTAFGMGSGYLELTPAQPAAIVSTLFLFGTGLIGLLFFSLRRRLSWQNLRKTPFTKQNPLSVALCSNEKAKVGRPEFKTAGLVLKTSE